MTPDQFRALWQSLAPIGRSPDGNGYLRHGWTEADFACREWFAEEAADRNLTVYEDGNGNLVAWWGDPTGDRAVLTGSHFDSVPHGGGYDGALGIVSAFLAIDELRARGNSPIRPVGVVAFAEEEGSRFGVACLGSRLLTGDLPGHRAVRLRDRDGVTLGEAMVQAGRDPAAMGADPALLCRLSAFVELHIEQGRALTVPVGVASGIWPHGRWRLDFRGVPNHAGTTTMDDRHDPMLTLAYTVLAANKEARLRGCHATVGRVAAVPNATNAIAAEASAWLDARAASTGALADLLEAVRARASDRAGRDGTTATLTAESQSPATEFDPVLRDRLVAVLRGAPVLATGAGHDAGVLAAHVPTAMLFVRNPTGVSHAPDEEASDVDCALGVDALADVLGELACR